MYDAIKALYPDWYKNNYSCTALLQGMNRVTKQEANDAPQATQVKAVRCYPWTVNVHHREQIEIEMLAMVYIKAKIFV